MPLTIDWYNQIIKITSPTTEVDMQTLHDFIEDQLAMPEGLNYPAIITPEGKIEDPVNPGIYSQIIVILQSPWQIQFWGGSGYTRIYGGKLVGGKNDEPLKATGTAGDISVLESPVDGLTVVSGGGLTEQNINDISDSVEERLTIGNRSIQLYKATEQDDVRKVAIGELDKMIINWKYDSDPDWSTPRRTDTLWAWYDTLGSKNPNFMKENG